MSKDKVKKPKVHELYEVDSTASNRGVWLVKVPKYLAERWMSVPTGDTVGKLKISTPAPPPPGSKEPPPKPEVVFTLDPDLVRQPAPADAPSAASTSSMTALGKPKKDVPIGADHKFLITQAPSQQMFVLTETKRRKESLLREEETVMKFAGKVVQRAECRPIADDRYMRMKRTHIETENKPNTQVIQLDRAVNTFKPTAQHAFHAQDMEFTTTLRPHLTAQRRRETGSKARLDRPRLEDMLFKAFEKHQYYSFQDLARLTDQPVSYLREVLTDLCEYNTKPPHKSMWELKPEFRHYDAQNVENGSGGGGA